MVRERVWKGLYGINNIWRQPLFILGVLIALGVLVIVHEAGHFLAARAFGVNVEKFSIGFGPKLLGYKYKGTNFLVSLIPLGGYVKMSGDEPSKDAEYAEYDFYGKKWWKRVIIVLAGPIANLILGLLLFSLSFGIGRTIEDHYPIIGRVAPHLENIVMPYDRIIAVNSHDIEYWSQLPGKTHKDDINEITILRDGMVLTMNTRDIQPTTWITDLQPDAPALIGTLAPGMPAYRVGLQPGDIITSVDGKEVNNWYEMRELIARHEEDLVELTILRGEETFNVTVPLETNILFDEEQKMIGITQQLPVSYFQRYNLFDSVRYGAISTATFIVINYYALYRMVSRPAAAKDQIGGPVMIVAMSRQTTAMGLGAIISFIASISLILMIMNLLPIPVLDGGHIFFYTIEGIFGKPIPLRVQAFVQQLGFMLLILLMIFVFYNDITRLVGRNLAIRNQQQPVEMIENHTE